jgi:hypothetical protein
MDTHSAPTGRLARALRGAGALLWFFLGCAQAVTAILLSGNDNGLGKRL